MQWNPYHTTDNRVVTASSIINIENYENLEARSGVYLFMDVNHQVKYVGKAGARRMVLEIYDAINNRNKDYGATKVKALYTNSDANAWSLETDLIDVYSPPNNFT